MKKMKMNKRTRAVFRRIISFAAALAMGFNCLSITDISRNFSDLSLDIRANAADAGTYTFNTVDQFVEYAAAYNNNERNADDVLVIAIGTGDTGVDYSEKGFVSIGSNHVPPFNGEIIINSAVPLNLPYAMFESVTDNVRFSGTVGALNFSRTYDSKEPLFAKEVVANGGAGSTNGWKFKYQYFKKTDNDYRSVKDFAGYIGTIGNNANVKVESITHNNAAGNQIANIVSSNGNVGLICGTLDAGANLTVNSITYDNGFFSNAYNISASAGCAGGLVGYMGSGSTLTVASGITNLQAAGKDISASGSGNYAGGIVGKCDGGTIAFAASSSYIISQYITGESGAGAIAGYYKTSGDYSVSTSTYTLSGCQINGTGACGGLFGMVENPSGNMTVTVDNAISTVHENGAAEALGSLIGKYTTGGNINNSLSISGTGAISVDKTGGSASYYGGVIGYVENAAYVKLSELNVTSSHAVGDYFFGGMIGSADAAFIELYASSASNGKNQITYSGIDSEKNFAGIVGNIGNGVLYLQGSTDLSGAATASEGTEQSGQIVGNRDSGLVFAASDWTLTRSSGGQMIDDIGSWGEVIRFNDNTLRQLDIITINSENGHYVTLAAPVTTMSTLIDFAKTALNIQHNVLLTTNSGVLRKTSSDSSTLLSGALALSNGVTIDLSGTGLTGLTRDNGTDATAYSGAFSGNNGTVILAVGENYFPSTDGSNGKIYRHQYNGLFAKTSGTASITGLTVTGTINVEPKIDDMRAAFLVAESGGTSLTINNTKVQTVNTGTEQSPNNVAPALNYGSSGGSIHVGGFVGRVGSGNIVIGDTAACEFNGTISGTASKATVGGVIGSIHGNAFTSSVTNTKVSGSISSAVSETGGLIAVINSGSGNRSLTLNGVEIKDLAITITHENFAGGLLGFAWNDTDVTFGTSPYVANSFGVKISGSSSVTAASANATTGLVYRGTGYWKVYAGGINIDSIAVTASAAKSFGMILNKGYNDNNSNVVTKVIYLELLEKSGDIKAYTINNATLDIPTSNIVFDELVAYSANGDVEKNGQGIVSINTYDGTNESSRKLKMGSSDTVNTGSTYQNQTSFAVKNNEHTRYYYNLDKYNVASPSSDAEKLLMWSVYQYAHSSIRNNINFGNTNTLTAADMRGYSYYPVDLSGTLKISGTLTLYNTEFDEVETATADNRETSEKSQHYTMQNSLLRNVSGTLNSSVDLAGSVNKIGDYCGALIMGTVSSDAEGKPAKINVDSLVLKGIKVDNIASSNNYAPLLINKAGSNVTINISGVSNDSTHYTSMGDAASSYIATSLLGKIGTKTSKAVKLTFSQIKLDGRMSAGVSDISALTNVYNSNGCLFKNAILVDTLAYADNSGSGGTYNFRHSEDWGASAGSETHTVTYGKEITASVENAGKQKKYSPEVGETVSQYFTHPTTRESGSEYDFSNNFQKYVFTGYDKSNKTHELRVNVGSSSFTGCGTYNDPYLITSEQNLIDIAKAINGLFSNGDSFTIIVPDLVTDSVSWCEGDDHHNTYVSFNGTNWTGTKSDSSPCTLSNDALRKYLAGAYYKIDADITLNSTGSNSFPGISNNLNDTHYVFRGVIEGGGHTIINKTNVPLIVSSNGSVVRNLTIEVVSEGGNNISISENSSKTFSIGNSGGQAYGAVIAKIFGGDNIIDDVKVIFGEDVIVKEDTATCAQLVPIGGYVGVIVNGGLIFRNMTGLAKDNQAGLTAENLSGFDGTNTDPVSEDNKRWLYINPIIGRVINGFAVTESYSGYHPYEDGTRVYKGATTDESSYETRYWNGSEEVTEEPSSIVGVTMRNGNKNYSIADIKSVWGKDSEGNISQTKSNGDSYLTDNEKLNTKDTSDSNKVSAPNAQAFFVMSLIVNSGMSSKTLGYTQSSNNMFRRALYNDIGTTVADSDDCKDYSDYASTDGKAIRGYLMANYTINDTDISGKAEKQIKLASGGVYCLPDGYKGIGNMYQNNDVYRMKITNFVGNGATISQNTSFYNYFASDFTVFDTEYTPATNVGVGLINYQPVDISASELKLTGLVEADAINKDSKTGAHIAYKVNHVDYNNLPYANNNKLGVDNQNKASVGSFIGYAIGTDITTDDVVLNNVYVKGLKSTGGLLGTPDGGITTITADDYDFEKIRVYGASCTGGLIGMKYQGGLNVDLNGKNFNLTEVECLCEGGVTTASDANYGVGGIIGLARSDKYDKNKPGLENSIIKHINIGALDQKTNISIKCSSSIFTGGLVGTFSRTNIEIEDCHFYNLNIESDYYSGGAIGHLATSPNRGRNWLPADKQKASMITNVTFEKSSSTSATSWIKSTGNSAGGIIGAAKCDLVKDINIDGCIVKDCTISSLKFTGGMIGVIGYASNDNQMAHNVIIKNSKVSNCVLEANDSVGGLVGVINQKHQGEKSDAAIYLKGYNILAENLDFKPYSSNAISYAGYICGYNEKAIQIAGFSRQDNQTTSTMIEKLVGYCSSSNTNVFGEKTYSNVTTKGYVIFADYNGDTSKTTRPSALSETSHVTVASPYVTINPQKKMDSNQKYLTGDGVSGTTYSDSVINKIMTAINSDSDKKRYQHTGFTSPEALELTRSLRKNIQSFESVVSFPDAASDYQYNGESFAVLVLDDINEAHDRLNDYLRLLTNSDFNFADSSKSTVYTTDITTWKYDTKNKNFVKVKKPSVTVDIVNDVKNFTISSTVLDNTKGQFTLIDVQFKDPNSSSNTAYHLYVPVVVKKMLIYNAYIRPASGTKYKLDAYPASPADIAENLGNPLTVKLTYEYEQSATEWQNQINSGESVYRNYDKIISINDQADQKGFPAGAKIVLVDPNGDKDKYYYSAFAASGGVLTGTSPDFTLDLSRFSNNDGSFKPVNLNDLMTVSIDNDAAATDKKLVKWSSADGDDKIVVEINDPDAGSLRGMKLRLANSNEPGKYAVKVTLPDNKNIKENYYLSIFTKENTADNKIYHYQLTAPRSFNVTEYPSARRNTDEVSHIYIGNLFTNSVTIQEDQSVLEELSSNNDALKAILTANVGLSKNAVKAGFHTFLPNNTSMHIYQMFMVSLDMIEGAKSTKGILAEPIAASTYYTISNDSSLQAPPSREVPDCKHVGAFIEMQEENDIKDNLVKAAQDAVDAAGSAANVNENNCKITITSDITMKYTQDQLAIQFPQRGTTNNGTKMIGYSNIASTAQNASASRVSISEEGTKKYYVEDIISVVLNYRAAENPEFANDGNGNFGQLGINAREDLDNISMNTVATYDMSEYTLKTYADSMKIEITLHNKMDSYTGALPIQSYLPTFALNDINGDEIIDGRTIIVGNESYTPDVDIGAGKSVYTYILPKECIGTISDDYYMLPINFTVLTGDEFEAAGFDYSNYMVKIKVSMLDEEGKVLVNTDAESYIIYTNAKIISEVVDPHTGN